LPTEQATINLSKAKKLGDAMILETLDQSKEAKVKRPSLDQGHAMNNTINPKNRPPPPTFKPPPPPLIF
jgi:hypothetical protein